MPYVNVQITKGATRAEKSKIVMEMTETLVSTLRKKPEHIHVVIQEVPEQDWGFAGKLTDEWRREQALESNED